MNHLVRIVTGLRRRCGDIVSGYRKHEKKKKMALKNMLAGTVTAHA